MVPKDSQSEDRGFQVEVAEHSQLIAVVVIGMVFLGGLSFCLCGFAASRLSYSACHEVTHTGTAFAAERPIRWAAR